MAYKKRSTHLSFNLPWIGSEEIRAVADVLRSGWLTFGPKTLEFERIIKSYTGAKCAVAVNSCTAGLHLSLVALGIGEGDEVLTTPFTFISVANVIVHQKAKPIFVDIEKDTYNIDPQKIEGKITPKTKAIILTHYGGNSCEMDRIMAIARKNKLAVIEDCAHAIGSFYKGKHVGTFGDTGNFSFYATKNITTGEGGMVISNRKKVAERIAMLRLHGMDKDAWKRYSKGGNWYYCVKELGYKYNFTDLQAAIGLEQFKKLNKFNNLRRRYAYYLIRGLRELKEITLPQEKPYAKNSWHLFPVLINKEYSRINRNRFIEELAKWNIGTSVHFIPIHLQPFYQKRFGYKKGDFPIAEYIYDRIVSLPLYPKMKKEDLDYLIYVVKEICKKYRKNDKA